MLVLRHIRELVTCAGPVPRRGRTQADVDAIVDGAVAADGERIVYAGPDRDLPSEFDGHPTAIDASS
jgi:imidazolonepropionase